MKRTPLLLTLLGINVALVSVVGVSILKDTGDPTPPLPRVDAVKPTNSAPRRTLLKREPKRGEQVPSARFASFAASPAVARTIAEVPVKDQTMNTETSFSTSNESLELLEEPARVSVPTAQRARAIPKWAIRPQAQVRLRSLPPQNGPAVAPLRDPAVENAPPSVFEPVKTAQAKAVEPSNSAPKTNAANPGSTNSGIKEIDPARSSPWPRGSFTREEQLYRAQFGWRAFSEELRKAALFPETP